MMDFPAGQPAYSRDTAPATNANAGAGLRDAVENTSPREAESEFTQAMQAYKQASGRMFPTWSEVLGVLRSLGYRKTD